MVKLTLIQGDCLKVLSILESESIDLIITSPPYNAGKSYECELSESEYYDFINPIVTELTRVLKDDGRFAINIIFNVNRVNEKSKEVLFPFFSWIDTIRQNKLCIKENIIWDQCNSGCETAWGSWKSASAPHIRHMTENIIIGYKNQWKKQKIGISNITTEEFMKFTVDKWRFGCARNNLHPAIFPEELPKRCIKLFSFVGDTILDPFLGSGTTIKVARDLNRNCIGIEINPEYIKLCKKRLNWSSSLDPNIEWEFKDLSEL